MRILLTCKKRSWCGETRYVAELANALTSSGQVVNLAAPEDSEVWLHLNGVNRRITLHLEHDFLALGKLTRDLLKLRDCLREADVVHCNASWDSWQVAWARKLFGLKTPFARTRHNLKRIRTHLGNRWLYQRAMDVIIAPSSTIHSDLWNSPTVPRSALRQARYAVDTYEFDPSRFEKQPCRDRLLSQMGSAAPYPIVVFAGRVVPRKQPALFLKAAQTLCVRGIDAHFLVVGQRPDGREFARQLRELTLGFEDRIHFLDFTFSMAELLAGCDISVLTADNEPFGLTVAEGMAMELGVVASASGGPREMIQDGINGLLFSPGSVEACIDCLQSLIENGQRRAELGRRARQRIQSQFSWQQSLSEHLCIYTELLERS